MNGLAVYRRLLSRGNIFELKLFYLTNTGKYSTLTATKHKIVEIKGFLFLSRTLTATEHKIARIHTVKSK
jgi:hypothetical protein